MQSFFEILGLPAGFTLNEKALETAYFTAQRTCHPDRFIGKPEAERVAAVSRSRLVNDAYETLKNPLTRAEHLLELQGIHAIDDTAPVPPALLMEMMELRERIAEAADGLALKAIVADIQAMVKANSVQLAAAFEAKDYAHAAEETQRLQYLGKAMEEAHMFIYRLKSAHAHG